jgi:hypothetical protein
MAKRAPRWRTATVDGRTVTYAVVQRGGRRVVLVKRGR